MRIPKSVIDQCGFGEHVELRVEEGHLILARDRKPREGWREAVIAAGKTYGRDELLLDGIPESEFDCTDWTW